MPFILICPLGWICLLFCSRTLQSSGFESLNMIWDMHISIVGNVLKKLLVHLFLGLYATLQSWCSILKRDAFGSICSHQMSCTCLYMSQITFYPLNLIFSCSVRKIGNATYMGILFLRKSIRVIVSMLQNFFCNLTFLF